jgi:hypothetical protein
VAKILSSHDVDAPITLHSLSMFDATSRPTIDRVCSELFSSCTGLHDERLNISAGIVSVLGAHLIKAFPKLKAAAPGSPLVSRVNDALAKCGVAYEELLGWSMHLENVPSSHPASDDQIVSPKHLQMMQHQAAVIDDLFAMNKKLAEKIRQIEALVVLAAAPDITATPSSTRNHDLSINPPPVKRRKKASTNLVDAWFQWFTMSPTACKAMDKQSLSAARQLVSYMRLFSTGYVLDTHEPGFRDRVLLIAKQLSDNVNTYFSEEGISARSAGTVLKAMRVLHREGKLNSRISDFQERVRAGIIIDPSPPSMLFALHPVA